MKIYFILNRPGYWSGTATTSKEVADMIKHENPEWRLLETDLKRVDFVPIDATVVSGMGSMKKEIDDHFKSRLSEYLYFKDVYNRNDPDKNWFQAVHEGYLQDLEIGIESRDFSVGFSGHSLYLESEK